MDSFPSYPLSDELFKIDINLTKEQEKQIEEYREELLIKDEIKKQENEKKAEIEKMKIRVGIYEKVIIINRCSRDNGCLWNKGSEGEDYC